MLCTTAQVFMVPLAARLDATQLKTILQSGHSRIPVYKDTRQLIIGLLLVKELVLLDPDDKVCLSRITNYGIDV